MQGFVLYIFFFGSLIVKTNCDIHDCAEETSSL